MERCQQDAWWRTGLPARRLRRALLAQIRPVPEEHHVVQLQAQGREACGPQSMLEGPRSLSLSKTEDHSPSCVCASALEKLRVWVCVGVRCPSVSLDTVGMDPHGKPRGLWCGFAPAGPREKAADTAGAALGAGGTHGRGPESGCLPSLGLNFLICKAEGRDVQMWSRNWRTLVEPSKPLGPLPDLR